MSLSAFGGRAFLLNDELGKVLTNKNGQQATIPPTIP
jgi:hypothetical protein